MKKTLIFLCALSLTAFAIPAFADIINGGFESGSLTGWTSAGDTSITSAGYDPRTNNVLPTVGAGNNSAKVGDEYAWLYVSDGAKSSSISQQFVVGTAFTDLYFAWAAVGLVPTNNNPHTTEDTPWFQILITDVTTSTQLFKQEYYTGNIGSITPGWLAGLNNSISPPAKNGAGIWYYRPWETFHLSLLGISASDEILLTLTTRDCTLGGHSSYTYMDGFGNADPLATPEPATLLLFGLGMVGLAGFRKRS